MTLVVDDGDREPARWHAVEIVLLQADWNHECGSVEPLNFDCADHNPFHNSDEIDDSDGIDNSNSSIGGPES